jgi:hypothetical protein
MLIKLDAVTGEVLHRTGELNKDFQTNDIELTPDDGVILAGHFYSVTSPGC